MEFILYTLAVVFILSIYLVGWFFAFSYAGRIRRIRQRGKGYNYSWWISGLLYLFISVGAICDTLFNWIYGTIIFRELPKEWLFSSRVRRWCHRIDVLPENWLMEDKRYAHALLWKERLNRVEPGHI